MKKFLVCHTEGRMQYDDEVFAVVGNRYKVTSEYDSNFTIVDERGKDHYFGASTYQKWFKLESEPSVARYFVNFLLKTSTGDLSLHYWVSGDEATNTLQAIDIAESRMGSEYGYTAKNITNAYVNMLT